MVHMDHGHVLLSIDNGYMYYVLGKACRVKACLECLTTLSHTDKMLLMQQTNSTAANIILSHPLLVRIHYLL